MGLARQCSFKATMLSGGTLTGQIDLGSAFRRIYLDIPTKGIGDMYIQGSAYDGGTFRRVMKDSFNTATVHQDFVILSAVSQKIVPTPVDGIRYLKIETSSGVTDGCVFNLICGD